jgi:DNA repair protein RecO (recombination protein O)
MLVDVLTPQYGRVGLVARGVRSRKTPKRNLLNPFSRLLISFQGKTDLKLLTHFEAEGMPMHLSGNYLFSGFYVNELLVRLLPEMDAHEDIFLLYEHSLQRLAAQHPLEPILRQFELHLLESLGYGIDLTMDAKSGEPVVTGRNYCLDPTQGFYAADDTVPINFLFAGEHIRALVAADFSMAETRQTAKRITRTLLRPLLGNKPLKSRELFVSGPR